MRSRWPVVGFLPRHSVILRPLEAAYIPTKSAGTYAPPADGLKVYLEAVEGAFGCDIDYSMLIKTYESTQDETRYSPAVCTSCERKPVMGHPDPDHISTSFVERQNLTMRMGMRRFTRLTNAFSKKVENHAYQVALHFMHYNFCRLHKTLRVTPEMEAGITDHVWTIEEMLAIVFELQF